MLNMYKMVNANPFLTNQLVRDLLGMSNDDNSRVRDVAALLLSRLKPRPTVEAPRPAAAPTAPAKVYGPPAPEQAAAAPAKVYGPHAPTTGGAPPKAPVPQL
jgi:hypothetical protein